MKNVLYQMVFVFYFKELFGTNNKTVYEMDWDYVLAHHELSQLLCPG